MKVVVYTLGCKVNQYESDGLIVKLKQKGYDVYTDIVPADVYILNSCAVTNEAEKKSRQTISKFKEQNKNAKIMVCGCASQKNPNQFKDIQGVSFVSGTANKIKLIDSWEKQGIFNDELPLEYEEEGTSIPTKTRAYIKIQDGCNNFCTYCIIPYLRGRSRSRDLKSILNEIDSLSKTVKEIVITGINITDYKIDGKKSFDVLVKELRQFKDVRFRLGSIEQGLIEEDFIKEIAGSNICPHFHLSLQSGCDKTLKKMNRKYTTAQFENSVKLLRKYFDNPSITTDVIVGFPEETEEDFKQTCEFVKKIGFYNIHIFPYSKRSGTVAEKMQQVDGNIKKQRVKLLTEINKQLNQNYIKLCENKIYDLLIEEKIDEYMVGHTQNYIKCYVKCDCKENEIIKVKITEPYLDGAKAIVINKIKENNMDNCIFCKISRGEIPSKKFYEDDDFFVIQDINPKAKKHYLAIPKNHYACLCEQNKKDIEILGKIINKISLLVGELGLQNGYRLIINQGEDGRQEVKHLHVHILGGEKLPD